MFKAAIFAALVAAPSSAQQWGELDCYVVREYLDDVKAWSPVESILETVNRMFDETRDPVLIDVTRALRAIEPNPDDDLISRLLADRCLLVR